MRYLLRVVDCRVRDQAKLLYTVQVHVELAEMRHLHLVADSSLSSLGLEQQTGAAERQQPAPPVTESNEHTRGELWFGAQTRVHMWSA